MAFPTLTDGFCLWACICQLHKMCFCLGTIIFWDGFCLWACICQLHKIYVCLGTIMFWGGFFLWACICQSKQNACLEAIIFLDGFFLWERFCHSSHDSPKRMSVHHYTCPGATFIVMVSFCVHFFVNHSNICKYLSVCNFDIESSASRAGVRLHSRLLPVFLNRD